MLIIRKLEGMLRPRNPLKIAKKPLTSVSKRVPGVHVREMVGEGLAERVGKGLAKGWRGVGEGLAKG